MPDAALLARIEASATRQETVHGGRRVVWRRFGSGPAMVMLHGGHGDWRHWILNIEPLSRHRTLWLPDMPGYGESDSLCHEGGSSQAMDRLVDAVAESMAALPGLAATVDMVAFSFGGFVAARLAAQGFVRRLALVGPVGHGGRRRQTTELVNWRSETGDGQRAALRANLATLMLHDPCKIDDLALAAYEAQVRASRFNTKAISRSGGLQNALAAFAGPLLLVWGEHDITAVPQDLAPRIAAGCRDAAWRIVEGAGHWVQYERDETVSALLDGWFTRPG